MPRSTALRLAIANIHRPGALTPTIVLSLGLGLALLVTVIEIDGNLRRQFEGALPDKAPSFYFIDIQSADADALRCFRARSTRRTPSSSACRCCAAASCRRTASRPKTSRRSRAPPGCCRATAASPSRPRCRAARRVVEGEWWAPDYQGPPLVSFEKKIAEGLGLKVGDPIVVNVLGRNIEATHRQLARRQLGKSRHQFRAGVLAQRLRRRAAHRHRNPDLSRRRHAARGNRAAQGGRATHFRRSPTVRVKDAIEAIGDIVRNLVLAVRGASMVALFAAVLVLGGALAAGHSIASMTRSCSRRSAPRAAG